MPKKVNFSTVALMSDSDFPMGKKTWKKSSLSQELPCSFYYCKSTTKMPNDYYSKKLILQEHHQIGLKTIGVKLSNDVMLGT